MAYYCISIPLAFILGIVLEIGYKGVWFGLISGYWVMFALMGVQLVSLDWEESIRAVH